MKNNTEPVRITRFNSQFESSLPATFAILSESNLVVHPHVSRIVLHGSRGPAGGFRPKSDIDLSLIVDLQQGQNREALLQEVSEVTLNHWQGAIEVDLAVIFDLKNCGLHCFDQTTWIQDFCRIGGVDCFGLYKTQKGFNGLVTNAGIQVRLMYPCLKIWQRGRLP